MLRIFLLFLVLALSSCAGSQYAKYTQDPNVKDSPAGCSDTEYLNTWCVVEAE